MSMSNWTRIADDAIESAFGVGGRLHLLRPESTARCVAYVEDGMRNILAIAAGADHGEACRMLVQMCYRDEHRPTTQEVAVILGSSDSRVRQMVMSGSLTPIVEGTNRHAAVFDPGDVLALVRSKTPA